MRYLKALGAGAAVAVVWYMVDSVFWFFDIMVSTNYLDAACAAATGYAVAMVTEA